MRTNSHRKTRREIYAEDLNSAKVFPISIATVNFKYEVNLAYVIRSALCFGAEEIYVIGSYPSRGIMNELSGSLFDYAKIKAFSNPNDFLKHIEQNDINLVSIELPLDELECNFISNYKFDFSKKLCLVVGHETLGVPTEILFKSQDTVAIEMHGSGHCLNTATSAAIALYEATRQFEETTQKG